MKQSPQDCVAIRVNAMAGKFRYGRTISAPAECDRRMKNTEVE